MIFGYDHLIAAMDLCGEQQHSSLKGFYTELFRSMCNVYRDVFDFMQIIFSVDHEMLIPYINHTGIYAGPEQKIDPIGKLLDKMYELIEPRRELLRQDIPLYNLAVSAYLFSEYARIQLKIEDNTQEKLDQVCSFIADLLLNGILSPEHGLSQENGENYSK